MIAELILRVLFRALGQKRFADLVESIAKTHRDPATAEKYKALAAKLRS